MDHYSYSALTLYETCPYAFYLEKIEGAETVENAFAQHGTLCHELIQQWADGMLKPVDMAEQFQKRYPIIVTASFPKFLGKGNYKQQQYEKAMRYFENFDCFNEYEVIGAEWPFETDLNGRKFVGVIDLILRDKNGDITICDHKSKSLSGFKKEQNAMYRQQYLYSKPYYEQFGCYPKYLMFNLFNEQMKFQREFDSEIYAQTINWANNLIDEIEACDILDFLKIKEKADMFCTQICSVRNGCVNGKH